MGKHRKINIGDTFYYLTIEKDLGIRQHGNRRFRFYLCNCKCGNQVEIPGTYIGKVFKSCGCMQSESRRKDIPPGTKFGRLKVIERTEQRKHNSYMYRCICDCGTNDVMVRSDKLRSGEVKSCGCLHLELFKENTKKAYANNFIENTSILKLKSDKPQRNNSSGVVGVSWHKNTQKWQARIMFKGKNYHLGYYNQLEDARKVREIAKEKLHVEFLKWYQENYKNGK